jgi:hypothetical protein
MKTRKRIFTGRLLLIFIALLLIIWGVVRGENKMTQSNAHYLCLDCLGIGD